MYKHFFKRILDFWIALFVLIGPRPLLPQFLPLYSPEQARRHEVRLGISGWAQCHGRNAIIWKESMTRTTGCVVWKF